jgi:hypothetical protein
MFSAFQISLSVWNSIGIKPNHPSPSLLIVVKVNVESLVPVINLDSGGARRLIKERLQFISKSVIFGVET